MAGARRLGPGTDRGPHRAATAGRKTEHRRRTDVPVALAGAPPYCTDGTGHIAVWSQGGNSSSHSIIKTTGWKVLFVAGMGLKTPVVNYIFMGAGV